MRPAAVVLASTLAALAFVRFGLGGEGALRAFVLVVLVALSVTDLERRVLPNAIVAPAAAVTLVAQSTVHLDRTIEWVACALGAALFLLLPAVIHRGSMGMGDVKLGVLIGAALGKAVVGAIVVAGFAAFPVALVMVVRGGAAARGRSIPFGPFLAVGAAVMLVLGSPPS